MTTAHGDHHALLLGFPKDVRPGIRDCHLLLLLYVLSFACGESVESSVAAGLSQKGTELTSRTGKEER